MRIAFFTPLSPQRSALADYGEGLAMGLAQRSGVTVDLFIGDDLSPDNPVITQQFRLQHYRDFEAQADQYDLCLYSMGDHADYHGYMLDLLERHPGIVILNDLVLHRCILQRALQQNKLAQYLDELEYAYGVRDQHIITQIQAGLGEFAILDYPLFEGVVDRSLGVIVQNQYARSRILAKRPTAKVACLPYPFFMPPGFAETDLPAAREKVRAELGWSDQLIVGSFGIFVPSKHLDACLIAFAKGSCATIPTHGICSAARRLKAMILNSKFAAWAWKTKSSSRAGCRPGNSYVTCWHWMSASTCVTRISAAHPIHQSG